MEPIKYDDQSYGIIRGSDLQRDGMYLELWSARNTEVMLCEIFYSDITHTMSFVCFEKEEIPLEVLNEFLRQSKHLLTPMKQEAEQGGDGDAEEAV